jgi:hypothetical protein
MRTMLLSQKRLSMDMFCICSFRALNDPTIDSNLSWMPSHSEGIRLLRQSFVHSFKVQRNSLVIDFSNGLFGLFLKPQKVKLVSFCVTTSSSEGVHLCISLQLPYDVIENNYKDLYLYLSATATHSSLHGTKYYRAAFVVESHRGQVWNLRYHCNLSFELCWAHHSEQNETSQADISIRAQYATSWHELRVELGKWLQLWSSKPGHFIYIRIKSAILCLNHFFEDPRMREDGRKFYTTPKNVVLHHAWYMDRNDANISRDIVYSILSDHSSIHRNSHNRIYCHKALRGPQDLVAKLP